MGVVWGVGFRVQGYMEVNYEGIIWGIFLYGDYIIVKVTMRDGSSICGDYSWGCRP